MYTFIFQSLLMCHKNSCSAYLPEPFCHLSFYLMPISHESSHYRFQSNLFPLWTAAVHIKEKKKIKELYNYLIFTKFIKNFQLERGNGNSREAVCLYKKNNNNWKKKLGNNCPLLQVLKLFLKKSKSHFPPTSKKERWSLPLSNIWSSQTTPHRILAKYQFHLPGP